MTIVHYHSYFAYDVQVRLLACSQLIITESCINVCSFMHLPLVYASMNWVSIGSDNGLSPGQHQTIIWSNAGILSIRAQTTHFNEILFWIQILSLKKCVWTCLRWNGDHFVQGGDELKIWPDHDMTAKHGGCRCWMPNTSFAVNNIHVELAITVLTQWIMLLLMNNNGQ